MQNIFIILRVILQPNDKLASIVIKLKDWVEGHNIVTV